VVLQRETDTGFYAQIARAIVTLTCESFDSAFDADRERNQNQYRNDQGRFSASTNTCSVQARRLVDA
jgi:hypothetical protein